MAVRVDLGDQAQPNPLRAARDQADALVALASFSQNGTSWRLLDEYIRYVDGEHVGWGSGFGGQLRPELSVHSDNTALHLEQLQTAVTPHLPVRDPRLHELIDAAAVLDAAAASTDPSALLQEVRIIELIASRCGAEWIDFLRDNYAIHWASEQVRSEIQDALFQAVFDDTLRGSGKFSELATIWSQLTSGNTKSGLWEFDFNYAKALTTIAELAVALPEHNLTARKLRTVATHTQSPATIDTWVEGLVQDHDRLLSRLLRCRNSLAHGGPINLAVAATVRQFSTRHAAHAASGAIWATIEQKPLDQAFQAHQDAMGKWRTATATAATAREALFGKAGSAARGA